MGSPQDKHYIRIEPHPFYLTLNDPPVKARIGPQGNLYFEDLPPSYRNQPLPYRLESRFYQIKGKPATLTLSGESGSLTIERNEALCCVRGFVGARDQGNAALAGAKVFLAGQVATSDENGNFDIRIPKNQQKRQLQIRISHPGYQDLRRTVLPELTPTQNSPTPFILTPASS